MKRYLYLLTSFSVLMSVSMGANVSEAEEINTENSIIVTESTTSSTEDT